MVHDLHMSGSAGSTRTRPRFSPTTRLHVASDCMSLVSMPTVALSSLKLCAKTHEVRHTPTPVRVPEVLIDGPLGGRGTTREGTAGTSTVTGPLVQVHSYSEHRGAQPEAAVGPGSVAAQISVIPVLPAWEKG